MKSEQQVDMHIEVILYNLYAIKQLWGDVKPNEYKELLAAVQDLVIALKQKNIADSHEVGDIGEFKDPGLSFEMAKNKVYAGSNILAYRPNMQGFISYRFRKSLTSSGREYQELDWVFISLSGEQYPADHVLTDEDRRAMDWKIAVDPEMRGL